MYTNELLSSSVLALIHSCIHDGVQCLFGLPTSCVNGHSLDACFSLADVQEILDGPCTLLVPHYTGSTLSVREYILAADGDWPAFVDPAGLVVDPQNGEPVELCPGGALRCLQPVSFVGNVLLFNWCACCLRCCLVWPFPQLSMLWSECRC